jgi:hypothetical protein
MITKEILIMEPNHQIQILETTLEAFNNTIRIQALSYRVRTLVIWHSFLSHINHNKMSIRIIMKEIVHLDQKVKINKVTMFYSRWQRK